MGAGHSHGHGHGHSHVPKGEGNERKLMIAAALTGGYLLVEVVAGFLSGSLALLSDAGHMMTDVAALLIALVAIRIGKRPADRRRTYGYYRFEILAAALNAIILFLVAAYILYEAYHRFFEPPEIQYGVMLGVAFVGMLVNLFSMRMLSAGSEESLNMKGAYLEVWSDLLGSVAVIIGAILIYFTGWWQIDPILAVLIGLWVLPRTWTLLSHSINILLEGVPEGLELEEIHEAIHSVEGVTNVHDLHVWAITSGRNSLTAHIVIDREQQSEQKALSAITAMLEDRFHITHSTIQVELEGCGSEEACAQPNTPRSHVVQLHRPHSPDPA